MVCCGLGVTEAPEIQNRLIRTSFGIIGLLSEHIFAKLQNTSTGPLCGGTAAVGVDRLLFNNHLSKSAAFQQSSGLKLLVADLQATFAMISINVIYYNHTIL